MTEEQLKAAANLTKALKKCTKAGLKVHALTEVGFYVLPVCAEPPGYETSDSEVQKWYADNGIDCGFPGLIYDGGAGV